MAFVLISHLLSLFNQLSELLMYVNIKGEIIINCHRQYRPVTVIFQDECIKISVNKLIKEEKTLSYEGKIYVFLVQSGVQLYISKTCSEIKHHICLFTKCKMSLTQIP